MALEYRLQIKTKTPLSYFLDSYLKEKNILFSKDETEKDIRVYLCDLLGFTISVLLSRNVCFDYQITKNQFIEEEWNYSSDMYFRLDKFYDNLLARLNMLDLCIYVLNNTSEDARLLFNGDVLVLERTNGKININKNFGFWNSHVLIDRLEMIN